MATRWKASQTLRYSDTNTWSRRTNGKGDKIGDFWRDSRRRDVSLLDESCAFSKTCYVPVQKELRKQLIPLYEWLEGHTPDTRGGTRIKAQGDLSPELQSRALYVWHTLRKQAWELTCVGGRVELSDDSALDALKELMAEVSSGGQPGSAARAAFLESKRSEEKCTMIDDDANAEGDGSIDEGRGGGEDCEDDHNEEQLDEEEIKSHGDSSSRGRDKGKQKEVARLTEVEAREALKLGEVFSLPSRLRSTKRANGVHGEAVDDFNRSTWRRITLGGNLSQALALFQNMVEEEGFSLKIPKPSVNIEPSTFNPVPLHVLGVLVQEFLNGDRKGASLRLKRYRKPNPLKRKMEETGPSNSEEVQRKKARPDEGDVAIEQWDDKMIAEAGAMCKDSWSTLPDEGDVAIEQWDDKMIAEAEAMCKDPWSTLQIMNASMCQPVQVRIKLIDAVVSGMEKTGEAIEAATIESAKDILQLDAHRAQIIDALMDDMSSKGDDVERAKERARLSKAYKILHAIDDLKIALSNDNQEMGLGNEASDMEVDSPAREPGKQVGSMTASERSRVGAESTPGPSRVGAGRRLSSHQGGDNVSAKQSVRKSTREVSNAPAPDQKIIRPNTDIDLDGNSQTQKGNIQGTTPSWNAEPVRKVLQQLRALEQPSTRSRALHEFLLAAENLAQNDKITLMRVIGRDPSLSEISLRKPVDFDKYKNRKQVKELSRILAFSGVKIPEWLEGQ
ncbi:hypothetical protein FRB90_004266 [Tulasnella sp. 427]|nr:hypothetical protein FRB90_004266 [Tulasnella sp. 427]